MAQLDRARRTLHETGVGTVEAPLPSNARRLDAEAHTLRRGAERVVRDAFELWADGQEVRSPVRYGFAVETHQLRALHESSEFHDFASELAGTSMRPTYSGYLFYEDGDFIGLHKDLPACELTFLVGVSGTCPPLVVHQELRGLSAQELKELAEASGGAPDGGKKVPVLQESVVALFGGGLPHQTRPIPAGGASIVATLCYAGV